MMSPRDDRSHGRCSWEPKQGTAKGWCVRRASGTAEGKVEWPLFFRKTFPLSSNVETAMRNAADNCRKAKQRGMRALLGGIPAFRVRGALQTSPTVGIVNCFLIPLALIGQEHILSAPMPLPRGGFLGRPRKVQRNQPKRNGMAGMSEWRFGQNGGLSCFAFIFAVAVLFNILFYTCERGHHNHNGTGSAIERANEGEYFGFLNRLQRVRPIVGKKNRWNLEQCGLGGARAQQEPYPARHILRCRMSMCSVHRWVSIGPHD